MKNALSVISLAAVLLAGCGGQPASPMPAAPAPVAPGGGAMSLGITENGADTLTIKRVGVRLTGEASIIDSRYGFILGYFKGKTSLTSEVVSLPAATDVRFFNVDSTLTHTVSFLGNATSKSAPWPSSFDGSGTKSPKGTAIGTSKWSTGALLPGSSSVLYNTGMPGFYMMGCAFHYNTNKMRTVIIVM